MDAARAAALARAALGADLPLEPLRVADAVTFRSPAGIVRVTPVALRSPASLAAEVAAARALAAAGAPVMAPLEGPLAVADALVVRWQDVPDAGARDSAAYAAMGRALRRFRDAGTELLAAGELAAAPWRPLEWLEARLARADTFLDRDLAAALRTRAAAEDADLAGDEVLLHTDAHADNFRVDGAGRAVLVDLEGLARGPWPYDLAPMAVGERRYGGDPARWRDAILAYGADPDDPALGPAIRLRELLAVAYVVGQAARDPGAMAVARGRMADVEARNDAVWMVR